tara:strand:- start:8398 stop:8745 length:348 start_codon:yes stop_codon:yes gene_type:complete
MSTNQTTTPEDNKQAELSEVELNEMANFKADIDDATMMELEEAASNQCRQQQRRLVLLAVSRDADFLSQLSIDEPEAYGEMLESAKYFLEHTKGLLSISESAVFRLEIADCRESE